MDISKLFRRKKDKTDNKEGYEYIKEIVLPDSTTEAFFAAAERVKKNRFLNDFIKSLGAATMMFGQYYIDVEKSLLITHLDKIDLNKAVSMIKLVAIHIILMQKMDPDKFAALDQIIPYQEFKSIIFNELGFEENEIEAYNTLEQIITDSKMNKYPYALTYYFLKNVFDSNIAFILPTDVEPYYFVGIPSSEHMVLIHGFKFALEVFEDYFIKCTTDGIK